MSNVEQLTTEPPGAPPLPPGAHHGLPEPVAAVAEPVPVVDGAEQHPIGTAQYIADIETELAEANAKIEAMVGRVTEGAKSLVAHVVHTVQMAGHYPQDQSLIPSVDEINAAGHPPAVPQTPA